MREQTLSWRASSFPLRAWHVIWAFLEDSTCRFLTSTPRRPAECPHKRYLRPTTCMAVFDIRLVRSGLAEATQAGYFYEKLPRV